MAVRLVAYSMSVVFLCSCFLSQNQPPATSTTTAFDGLVVLEDMRGALVEEILEVEPMASIWANFEEIDTSSRGAIRMAGRGIYPAARKAREEEDVECEFYTFKENPRQSYRAVSTAYLSVGEMSFGTSMQSSFMSLEQAEDNQYKKELEPDFPPGEYLIMAEGTEDVKGFGTSLWVPKRLYDVSANGSPFDSSVVVIRKNEDIEFTWRKPTVPEKSYIMLDIKYEEDGKQKMLSCLTTESLYDIEGESEMKWVLPREKFADVPAVEAALLFFHRLLVEDVKDSSTGTKVQLQGWRTYWGAGQIID